MDKKLSRKGLVVVAPEVQGSSQEDILQLVEKNDVGYTVTKGITGPGLATGIPRTAVFDVSGKLVYVGHPMAPETEDAIEDALKEATSDESEKPGSSGLAPRKTDLVPSRSWTNDEKRVIEASLLEVVGTVGKFKLSNGQPFDYDITRLSEADQQLIKEALAP
jgi:hypothetical protein